MRCEEYLEQHDLLLDHEQDPEAQVLAAEQARALQQHRASCHACAKESERNVQLMAKLAALPLLEPSATAAVSVSEARRPAESWRWTSVAVPVLAAAAACLLTFGVLRQTSETRGVIEAQKAARVASPQDGIVVRLEVGSRAAFEEDALVLERGTVTLSVRPGTPYAVEVGAGRVEVKGTLFTVQRHGDDGSEEEKEIGMEKLKTAALAAGVSVVVTTGTVLLINPSGEVEVQADQVAYAAEGAAPKLQSAAALSELEGRLEATKQKLTALQERADSPELRAELKAALQAVGDDRRDESPAWSQDKLDEEYEKLVSLGINAASNDKRVKEVAEALAKLGDGGRARIRASMQADTWQERFVAAMLARELYDEEFAYDLENAAIGDESKYVRRMSSSTLMRNSGKDSVDLMKRVFDAELNDPGVRLNAWVGLARTDVEAANARFGKLLDSANEGVGVPGDYIVKSALGGHPGTEPALVQAVTHPKVSDSVRIMVIKNIAASEWSGARAALQAFAQNASLSQEVRNAAAEALR